ncbi:MAG: NDP-sugar synthase [Methanomassiliicoccales archaeon]|nr:MAG: NDP-sugar synthase [Methanomassiliicoccales archaeon]
MKAVILAGGEGIRLKPLTYKRPKPLIPIAGEPCIDYMIKSLVSADFKRIIVTTGYMSDTMIRSVGDGKKFGASIVYAFEETPAGTAGAVKNVSEFLDDTFVVASGDVLADVDIKALFDYHQEKKAVATMALTTVQNPSEFGIVGLDDDNRIIQFKEKPKEEEIFSNLINAGIYILEPEVLDFIPENQMFDFSKNVFPLLLQNEKPIYGAPISGLWMDIGRPYDVLSATFEVVERNGKEMSIQDIKTEGKIIIGEGVSLEKDVTIKGPCYIGSGIEVGRNSVLEKACIYDNVRIDRGVLVKNSIIMSESSLGWRSEVVNSIVSNKCTLEDDVKLADSVIGAGVTIKKHSVMADANISPSET